MLPTAYARCAVHTVTSRIFKKLCVCYVGTDVGTVNSSCSARQMKEIIQTSTSYITSQLLGSAAVIVSHWWTHFFSILAGFQRIQLLVRDDEVHVQFIIWHLEVLQHPVHVTITDNHAFSTTSEAMISQIDVCTVYSIFICVMDNRPRQVLLGS